jgi:pimeloyl-ACP methyl ester carboxylesterase
MSIMTVLTRNLWSEMLGYPLDRERAPVHVQRGCSTTLGGIVATDLVVSHEEVHLPALRLAPAKAGTGKRPAVLYCHAHGNRYDIGKAEIIDGRPALLDPPLGVALAEQGYIVLCVDMTGFGDRRNEGSEEALAKAALWQGRSLLGDMLADLAIAHQGLLDMPDVDDDRIATVGLSMGATLAYCYAALTPRIVATAHMCAFADMAPLVETGAHDLHGIYMVVPGLLRHHDLGDVAALVAPRSQLVCSGLKDPLTPSAALGPALKRLRAAYAGLEASDRLTIVTDPQSVHEETPEFRTTLLQFLQKAL